MAERNPTRYFFAKDQIKYFVHSKEVEQYPNAFRALVRAEHYEALEDKIAWAMRRYEQGSDMGLTAQAMYECLKSTGVPNDPRRARSDNKQPTT